MKYHGKILTKHFEFVVKIFLEYLSECRIWGLKIKEWSLINDVFQFLASFIQLPRFLELFCIFNFSFKLFHGIFLEKPYYWSLKYPVNSNLSSGKSVFRGDWIRSVFNISLPFISGSTMQDKTEESPYH